MARKTFISYKYSEATELRDAIIDEMGSDATYYKGEDGFSDDLSDSSADTIKRHLKNMLYDTSVTIVIISPNMKKSDWIEWEIEYSLKEITRKDKTSRTNGVVGVIQKVNGGYTWLKEKKGDSSSYKDEKLPSIITKNRFNQTPPVYIDVKKNTVDELSGSYIAFVEEDAFLKNPSLYIENAYDKSQKVEKRYKITKQA